MQCRLGRAVAQLDLAMQQAAAFEQVRRDVEAFCVSIGKRDKYGVAVMTVR
jgi:hypothetical protein